MRYLLPGLIPILVCCGRQQSGEGNLSLGSPFAGDAEAIPAFRRCAALAGTGCATIQAAGTLVQGGFTFEDIFVKCTREDGKMSISIANSLEVLSTFEMRLIVPLQNKGNSFVCTGAVRECSGRIRVHATWLDTSSTETCRLIFNNEERSSGMVECPYFQSPNGTLLIGAGSRFQCEG